MASREFDRIPKDKRKIIDGYLASKPVPLGAMARDLGIEVKVSSLQAGRSGLIERTENGYRIKINRYETRERQRFTLAHEISHFLLHRDLIDKSGEIVDNVLYRSGQSQQVEFEANRLAADLIMPDGLIQSDLDHLKVPITEDVIDHLATEWQVSKAAMEIKLGPVAT